MVFILDTLREKLGTEEDETKGFPDMNYRVGNTSGLDVGNIPTPIARRVGDQAQIGGGVMEVQIYNPSTFQIEKPELLSSIQQLGIDISLHSDPNTGYTSPYKTRGGQARGYEPTHDYFNRYLKELAKFKNEVEQREDLTFTISRINPHASTSLLPPTDERMAQDVGLDPFGYSMSELEDAPREGTGKNIYDNPEFLKKFYHTFILDEVDEPYQIYQLFARFSPQFRDDYWREAQAKACNNYWREIESYDPEEPLREKIAMIQSARMSDQGIGTEWLDIYPNIELENTVNLTSPQDPDQQISIDTLATAERVLGEVGPNIVFQELRQLDRSYYDLQSLEEEMDDFEDSEVEALKTEVSKALDTALNELWYGGEEDRFLISVETKISVLNSRLDLQQTEIRERAQQIDQTELSNAAEKVMMGESDFFESERGIGKGTEEEHQDMLNTLLNSFEQALWMESNLLYRIIPAWMSTAENSTEDHQGWEAPKFIWDTIVEDKWGDKIDIDLTNPREYFKALENHREFMMDVAAASAACYLWGHFTQKESEIEIEDDKYLGDVYFKGTWAEWMNRFGIGVNIEAMEGSAQEYYKLWRPKDIAVAARAVNMTADKIIKEKDQEWHEDLDQAIAKFTIDMEHVAAYGVDPWKEMEKLIEQERRLANSEKYDVQSDEDKPLAHILRMMHLMKPGVESQQGTRHGPFMRGEKTLYTWLYRMIEAGFTRNPNEPAYVMYEQAEEKSETIYVTKIALDMIQLGLAPDEVKPEKVDPGKKGYDSEEEALIARFFRMDNSSYEMEWAKIEQHAFDPLQGLLQTEEFDHTWSSRAAMDQGFSMRDWPNEEYR